MPSLREATTIEGVSFEIDTTQVLRALRRFPNDLEKELANQLDRIKRKQFKELKARTGIKFRRPLRRGLFGRLQGYVNTSGGISKMSLRMVSYSRLIAIHETGDRITAKPGHKLAIPTGFALTSTGRTKKQFRDLRKLDGETFASGDYIFWRKSARSKLRLVRVLQRSVRIPARLKFLATWRTLDAYVQQRLDEAAAKAIKRGKS